MVDRRSADECFWKQAEPYLERELKCLRAALDSVSREVSALKLSLGKAQVKLAVIVGAAAVVMSSVANIAAAYVIARYFGIAG